MHFALWAIITYINTAGITAREHRNPDMLIIGADTSGGERHDERGGGKDS